jgi:aminotransferase EvaB
MTLGVGAGDEVITVANTCLPTIAAIWSVGARPVFVDVRPDDLMMDVAQVEASITEKTKCLLPVHLWGQAVDMPALLSVARRHGLVVVEDCAQAQQTLLHGQPVGTFGEFGCFSFYPTKNIGAYGDAGAVVTNDDALARNLRRLRTYGLDNSGQAERYGINGRIAEIQAAILRIKLPVYPQWLTARRQTARVYDRSLGSDFVRIPVCAAGVEPSYHQYVVRCADRTHLIETLRQNHIAYGIHYPVPMHRMPAYLSSVHPLPRLPVTEQAASEILSLPIHEALTPDQAERIVQVVNECEIRGRRRAA